MEINLLWHVQAGRHEIVMQPLGFNSALAHGKIFIQGLPDPHGDASQKLSTNRLLIQDSSDIVSSHIMKHLDLPTARINRDIAAMRCVDVVDRAYLVTCPGLKEHPFGKMAFAYSLQPAATLPGQVEPRNPGRRIGPPENPI